MSTWTALSTEWLDRLVSLTAAALSAGQLAMLAFPDSDEEPLDTVCTLTFSPPPLRASLPFARRQPRAAYFVALGQISPAELELENTVFERPDGVRLVLTNIAFWLEARPNPVSAQEWLALRVNLAAVLARVDGPPVDTSGLLQHDARTSTVRLRVRGGYNVVIPAVSLEHGAGAELAH